MEHIPAKISRRKLALGGPAALAMTPLAPLTKLSALAAPAAVLSLASTVHTSAEAAYVDPHAGFIDFYQNVYSKYCQAAVHNSLIVHRKGLGLSTYTPAQYKLNETLFWTHYNELNASTKNEVALGRGTQLYIALNQIQRKQHEAAVLHCKDILLNDRNRLYQLQMSRPVLLDMMQHFYYIARSSYNAPHHQSVLAARAKAKQLHVSRHLKGEIDDRLMEILDATGKPTGKLNINFGNLRKPVKQADLVSMSNDMSVMLTNGVHRYTPTSIIQNGKDSKKLQDLGSNTLTSTAFELTQDQMDGFQYYIDREMETNGPFQGFTEEESRRMLKTYMVLVGHQTGQVYPTYFTVQMACRTLSQTTIAVTRNVISNGAIDLNMIQTTVASWSLLEPSYDVAMTLKGLHKGRIFTACGVLIAIIGMSAYLAISAMTQASKVVNENKDANGVPVDDVAANTARTFFKMQAATALPAIGVSLLALGIFGIAATPTTFTTPANAALWVGRAFAASDLVSGVTDMVTAAYKPTKLKHWYLDPTKNTLAMSAMFRIVGAVAGTVHPFYKIVNWHKKIDKALDLTTFTAAGSAACAFMAMVTSLWDIDEPELRKR